MSRAPMPDAEVRQRLDKIKSYNAYFAKERDKEGQQLTQHIVGPAQLFRIMEREWHVDPKKYGIHPDHTEVDVKLI